MKNDFAFATSRRFAPHFHMPLQSGSDTILERMRRRYRTDLYAERVARIKELMPHACIGADVITAPPSVIKSMANHILTDKGLAQFNADWAQTGQKIL